MTFAASVQSGFNNFLNPTGRPSVSGFWWYVLCLWILSGVLGTIGGFINGRGMEQDWLGIIFEVFSALLFASTVCASIRRLHDSGKSGWNVWWYIFPVVGWIIIIVMLCRSSQPGSNKYGPQPQ